MKKILLLLLFLPWLTGATYYVDFTGGADTNNGTATGTAFKHCPGDANATNTAASTTLSAGDTVIFKGGVEYAGTVVVSWSGASGSPITYDGNSAGTWGTGRAIIDGTTVAITAGFLSTSARNYVTIKNFEIRDMQYNASGIWGISLGSSNTGNYSTGLIIQDCYVHELGKWANTNTFAEISDSNGITIRQGDTCTITGNTVTKVGKPGIQLFASRDCTISDNTISYVVWGIDVSCYATQASTDNLITGNTIFDLYFMDEGFFSGTGDPPHTDFVFIRRGGDETYVHPDGNIIDGNLFYNNYEFTGYGGTAMGYMSYADNTVWRNNVFINPNSYYVLESGHDSAGTVVQNNTFYAPRSGCKALYFGGIGTTQVKNNLIYSDNPWITFGEAGDLEALTAANSDYNLWITTASDIASVVDPTTGYSQVEWAATGRDAHSVQVADLAAIKFKNTVGYPTACETMDLGLQAGSPAIGTGADLSATFTTDYLGLQRNAWDIGAYRADPPTFLPWVH